MDEGISWDVKRVPSNTPPGETAPIPGNRRTPNFFSGITPTPEGFSFGGRWGEIWSAGTGADDSPVLETPGRRDHLRAIDFGMGRYVSVGRDQGESFGESRIWTSDNLEDWSLANFFPGGVLNDLIFAENRFVAVGGNSPAGSPPFTLEAVPQMEAVGV